MIHRDFTKTIKCSFWKITMGYCDCIILIVTIFHYVTMVINFHMLQWHLENICYTR